MAGGGASSAVNVHTPIVDNFPVAIGAMIRQGNIGTGSSQQSSSSQAQGGTASLSLAGLGLMNLYMSDAYKMGTILPSYGLSSPYL